MHQPTHPPTHLLLSRANWSEFCGVTMRRPPRAISRNLSECTIELHTWCTCQPIHSRHGIDVVGRSITENSHYPSTQCMYGICIPLPPPPRHTIPAVEGIEVSAVYEEHPVRLHGGGRAHHDVGLHPQAQRVAVLRMEVRPQHSLNH